jgi:phage terminase large subunit
MPKEIEIPYVPHKFQETIHKGLKRFNVVITHRRFGKTYCMVNECIKRALTCTLPAPRVAYIAPLYRQSRDVAWAYFKYFTRAIPGVKYNENRLEISLPWNDAKISLYGGDSPDSLRGIYLDWCVIDETANIRPTLWVEVIRPALADRKGGVVFCGTPQGKNLFWKLYNEALEDPANWGCFMFKASETGILDNEELLAAKKNMSADAYQQEFECSFDASLTGAYYAYAMLKAEEEGRICDIVWSPELPVYTAWDLGMSDDTSIWFYQRVHGGMIRFIDYYEDRGKGLNHYANLIHSKPYTYHTHFAPHDISVRELGTGKSRIEVATSLGVPFKIVKKIPLQDGINAVRLTLPKCYFNARKCAQGIEALRSYRRDYNEKLLSYKSAPIHDWASHAADSFRYFAVSYQDEEISPMSIFNKNHHDVENKYAKNRPLGSKKPYTQSHPMTVDGRLPPMRFER